MSFTNKVLVIIIIIIIIIISTSSSSSSSSSSSIIIIIIIIISSSSSSSSSNSSSSTGPWSHRYIGVPLYPHKISCLLMRIKYMIIHSNFWDKKKILPTDLQGNYGPSLGEFSNTSYGVVGAERVKELKTPKSKFKVYKSLNWNENQIQNLVEFQEPYKS